MTTYEREIKCGKSVVNAVLVDLIFILECLEIASGMTCKVSQVRVLQVAPTYLFKIIKEFKENDLYQIRSNLSNCAQIYPYAPTRSVVKVWYWVQSTWAQAIASLVIIIAPTHLNFILRVFQGGKSGS